MLNNRNIVIACAWAAAVLFTALAYLLGYGNAQLASLLLSVGSLFIAAVNWHEHRGGRSASFIFLVLGCVFLCGRAFPVLLGDDSLLARVEFAHPYYVKPDTVMTYVMLVLASFFMVHMGSLLAREPSTPSLRASRLNAKIYWAFFLIFLPVYLYKNVYYFNYIMNNGGYLAIYQGRDFVEGVGVLARVGSLLCMAAFTLYFFHEPDQKRSGRALIFFLIVFASELLVGLRGKFFVTALVFFLFHKLRFGGKFSMRGLVLLLVTITVISIAVAVTREQKSENTVTGLTAFLAGQGVSAGVSLVVLEDPSYFFRHSWSYFWHQFAAPLYAQPEVPQGWFLANDVSIKIQPDAYALGFGTGSSYLAELYLLGGVAGVVVGSAAIGWLLGMAGRFCQGIPGALMFWVVAGIVYYPRTMLQEPVHNLMRNAAPILLLAACCLLVRRWRRVWHGQFNQNSKCRAPDALANE